MGLGRAEAVVSSGAKTADAAITTVPALVYGAILRSGTANSRVDFRNGGSSGTINITISLDATTDAGDTNQIITFSEGVIFTTDLYLDITGTSAEAFVFYKPLA